MKEENQPTPQVELKLTGDGSHTLFLPELREHYHSVYGAVAESRHIFLETGFRFVYRPVERINILEVGFGTGLNALLTYIESEVSGSNVEYTAIELYPLKNEIFSKLNYTELIKYPDIHRIFLSLHQSPWNEPVHLTSGFSLNKINIALKDYEPARDTFDLVYFDAFGPDVQPEMWTREMFDKMAFCLKKDGILVTYSTKGTVKRNLAGAGFSIEKLPGPEGKREILRAIKI